MADTPLTVVDETEETPRSRFSVTVDWKAFAKKAAVLSAAALGGAAIYAVVTAETEDEDSNDLVELDSAEDAE
jgi:hypothetical protein